MCVACVRKIMDQVLVIAEGKNAILNVRVINVPIVTTRVFVGLNLLFRELP